MGSSVDLHPAAERLVRLVEGSPDDALEWPTPCSEYSVAALLDHLAGTVVAFRAAAVKNPLPGGPSGDARKLRADWRTSIPRDTRALADAWDDPAAWTGATAAGGVELPAGVAGIVALDELVVHGWDLARATHQAADYDGPGLEAVLDLVIDFRARDFPGLFGPEVPIPDGAALMERILGVTGRDPGWEPPPATS